MPFRDGFGWNDGGLIRILLQDGPEAKRSCALVVLTGLQGSQIHPREWDPALVEQSTALHDRSFEEVLACMMAHLWADGRDDFVQAGVWIDRALTMRYLVNDALRGAVLLDAAFHEACHREDPDGAVRLLKEAYRCPLDRRHLLRTDAAISLAERKRVKAEAAPCFCGYPQAELG